MTVEAIRGLVVEVLERAGASAEAASLQADVLVEAELRGHPSHGLLRVGTIVERIARGLTDPTATGMHAWRATALLDVDGELGLGPVVATRAVDAIAERARTTGVAAAAVRRASHLGMLAWYVERVARGGQVAIATCTSEALVHPWNGREALVGTNPLAVGVPADPRPLVLDMSTGRVSMGRIIAHARRGEPIPEGWALDAAGDATTNAAAAVEGAIAPFGGAKGYALGIALEALIVAMTGTATGRAVRGTLDTEHPSTKGDLFIVLDAPDPDVVGAISAYLQAVRDSPPATPGAGVTVPGDRATAVREQALRDGIDVSDSTMEELLRLREGIK